MAFFSLKSPALIGLDIRKAALRLVQLRRTKTGWFLQQMAFITLTDDIFADCKIKNWTKLCMVLKELVESLGLTGGIAAIHLQAQDVRMQRMILSGHLSDADIEAEIYVQVLKDLPGNQEALCIDYQTIAVNDEGSDIFFTAARQAYVSQYVKCVNDAGLTTKIVDVDIYALKRAISFSLAHPRHKQQIIFYSAFDVATLVAFQDDTMVFFKDWEICPQTFLMDFKNTLQLGLTTLDHVDCIIVCAEESLSSRVKAILAEDFTLVFPNPFRKGTWSFGKSIDENFALTHATQFFIALGLAMREVPKW